MIKESIKSYWYNRAFLGYVAVGICAIYIFYFGSVLLNRSMLLDSSHERYDNFEANFESFAHLLENAVTGSLYDEAGRCGNDDCSKILPYDSALRKRGNDWPVIGHTMVGHLRIQNVRIAVEEVVRNRIPGDFVEMGVWRGGVCIYARLLLDFMNQRHRLVHLFDAFENLPGYGNSTKYLAVSEADVRRNFNKYGALHNTYFYKGLFRDTVKNAKIQKISILRIDGNFYDSYQDALYYFYESVPVGGIVIFDDILSHSMVMRCWLDFKSEQKLIENLTVIDDHSAWFKKKKHVHINFSFFRRPQDSNKVILKKWLRQRGKRFEASSRP